MSRSNYKQWPSPVYKTSLGKCFNGKSEDVLAALDSKDLHGGVDLIFTSPPFPLNKKKKYGNHTGQEYIDWIAGFADRFKAILKPTGSIVMEVGNAWEPGNPVMSTLSLKALLAFLEKGKFHLCQQFIWNTCASRQSARSILMSTALPQNGHFLKRR